MKSLVLLISFVFLTSCATGERITSVREGMTKNEVYDIMGGQDKILQKDGKTMYVYKNRMVSGWSWEKTDYAIIFDQDGKVISVKSRDYVSAEITPIDTSEITCTGAGIRSGTCGSQIQQDKYRSRKIDFQCKQDCVEKYSYDYCDKQCEY